MKNRKISFVLFTSIFVSAICIAVYVYTTFFFNKRVMEENYKIFEQRVELISRGIEKNINLYSKNLERVSNNNLLKNFIIKIINSDFTTDEDKSYLLQLLNKNNLSFSDIALYKGNGSVIFSSRKNQKPLYEEIFWDKIGKNNLDINTTYDLENNGVRSIAKIKDAKNEVVGYLSLKIPNSVFNILKANIMGDYTLTETSIIYATDTIKDLNYNIAQQIEPMLTVTKGYISLKEIPYKVYIASAKDNSNLMVGAVIKDSARTKTALEYIILVIFSLSFIFIAVSFVFFMKNRNNVYKDKINDLSDTDLDKLLEDEFDDMDGYENVASPTINGYFDKDDDNDNTDEISGAIDKEILDIIKNLDMDIEDEINNLMADKEVSSNDKLEDVSLEDMKTFISNIENNELDNKMDDTLDNIYVTDGVILDSEILKMENDYFSSDEAFSFDDSDFLNIITKEDKIVELDDTSKNGYTIDEDDDERIILDDGLLDIDLFNEDMLSLENDNSYNMESMVDEDDERIILDDALLELDDIFEEEEVPKIPDDYYTTDTAVGNKKLWDKILDKPYLVNILKNKSMDEIINKIKDDLSINVDKALYAKYDAGSSMYKVSQSLDIEDTFLFTIKEDEPLYTKLLSQNNVVFIDDPMESDILSSKFSEKEHVYINKLIFVPVDNDSGTDKKDYFIILKLSNI